MWIQHQVRVKVMQWEQILSGSTHTAPSLLPYQAENTYSENQDPLLSTPVKTDVFVRKTSQAGRRKKSTDTNT